MEDEFRDKVNAKAKELGLDYRLSDLVVSLKGNVGEILIATAFECSNIKGNFEKYNKDKHKLLEYTDNYVLKNCNHCSGKGTVEISGAVAHHSTGWFNGYNYKDNAGDIKCKECNGAGIVKYIIQTVELKK